MIEFFIGLSLYTLLVLIITALVVYATIKQITKKIYVPMKLQTMNMTTDEFFNELGIIIENEIQLYERDIFANGGKQLNNMSFDNYYRDICSHIFDDIPEEFYERFSYYMTKESINKFIARSVKIYLTNKLHE